MVNTAFVEYLNRRRGFPHFEAGLALITVGFEGKYTQKLGWVSVWAGLTLLIASPETYLKVLEDFLGRISCGSPLRQGK